MKWPDNLMRTYVQAWRLALPYSFRNVRERKDEIFMKHFSKAAAEWYGIVLERAMCMWFTFVKSKYMLDVSIRKVQKYTKK